MPPCGRVQRVPTGRYSRRDAGALRLSFAGLPPEEIRRGVAALGRIVAAEMEAASQSFEPAPAMV
jgi:2-aminoadipate transaminase